MTEFLQHVLSRLAVRFDPDAVGAALADVSVGLLAAALTLAVFVLAWILLRRPLEAALQRTRVDDTTASFVRASVKYGLVATGLVAAAGELGVHTASLVASLGVAGLTMGFAARDALSNIISGLLIYWDRPFVIDDLVEVEGHSGRVDRITLRSTRVVTADGRMLAIPNSDMVNKTVASYSNFPHLRISVGVTIGVDEEIGRVRELLLGLVEDDSTYLSEPEPRVVVTELGDYNVALELRAWIRDERAHARKRGALREQVYETLRDAGVEMPYETLELRPVEVRQVA
jgi:small conductance mechanosensitive channel